MMESEVKDGEWIGEVLQLLDRENGDKNLKCAFEKHMKKMEIEENKRDEDCISTRKFEEITFKLVELNCENKLLKDRVYQLESDIKSLDVSIDVETPKTEEEIDNLVRMAKKAELLLKQKSIDAQKTDSNNAELSIRLELEQERRIRAQNVIGEVEKERIAIKNVLEGKNSDFEQNTQETIEVRLDCETKLKKMTSEVKKLEQKIEKVTAEKDQKNVESQKETKELVKKVDYFEQRYGNQLEISKTLQNELQASYIETQSLIKEMQMLNLMFAELEGQIWSNKDHSNMDKSNNDNEINHEENQASQVLSDQQSSLLQESCFNEVSTKHGTKMVLSVSRTFLKLKDLILEKNSVEEQLTKMRNVNDVLCSHVNIHEEKLCCITDELNNTWFYVSKIKEQHKKLHNSEQILRAELAEKRQLLKNIRIELEESRASWNIVKQKNAESEKQWIQLKADFDERKRLLMSSSESGISDIDIEEDSSNISALENDSENEVKEKCDNEILDDEDDDIDDCMSIPDPFSDADDTEIVLNDPFSFPLVSRQTSMVNDDEEDDNDEDTEPIDEPNQDIIQNTPIFVPSLNFLTQVPASLQPDLLGSGKGSNDLSNQNPSRDRLDDDVLEDVDDNVRDLINRLSSSTSRGAFLANRLADIHKRIATGASLTEHNEWFDETETDIDPKESEYEDDMTIPSPELESELEEIDDVINEGITNNDYFEDNVRPSSTNSICLAIDSEVEDIGNEEIAENIDNEDDLRPASTDSMILAIDEAINILDPVYSQPSSMFAALDNNFSSIPNPVEMERRQSHAPNFEDEEEDDNEQNEDMHNTDSLEGQPPDGSANVTRFLIKHLPKQLTQLRNQKHELEEKNHDLEQVVSQQRSQISEHERRVTLEKNKVKQIEDRLTEVESRGKEDTKDIKVSFQVPVEVDQENFIIYWTTVSRIDKACCYWVDYVPKGAEDSLSVIIPNTVEEVTPTDIGVTTTVSVLCAHKGKYTLHIEGNGSRMPQVSLRLKPVEEKSDKNTKEQN